MLFGVVLVAACAGLMPTIGWRGGFLAGFDITALSFIVTLPRLLRLRAADMRQRAAENDANRGGLLAISVAVNLVVLVAVGFELAEQAGPTQGSTILIVGTLVLAWLFANLVYALHYAHIFYLEADNGCQDRRGLEFPGTTEPGYWDFIYFGFTSGMTFQTSDVQITTAQMRTVSIIHAGAAFVFNLGVIAFTINILGRGG